VARDGDEEMLQTVNRAGRVLDLFGPERPEWGATAVARELDVSKSQAHELLVSLAEIGLLQRGGAGRYRLGWRIPALNSRFMDTNDVGRQAARVMQQFVVYYGETMQLAVWGRGHAICIAVCEGRHSIAISPWPVGADLPAHCTGAGKVLLASRPWAEVRDMLARSGLERKTEHTIVTGDDLAEELTSVRRRGFAYEDSEHALHDCGVAAPVVDSAGAVIAAVSMSVSVHRWQATKHEYTRALVAAAERVSRGGTAARSR
jgi:IclR family KDG regulon transcriptional repressor